MQGHITSSWTTKVCHLGLVASFAVLASCGGGSSGMQPPPPPPPQVNSVVISPANALLLTGKSQLFTAQVTGTGAFNASMTWSVNDVEGGNSTYGTIVNGQYTAPGVPPNPSGVTIKATSVQDSAVFGLSSVTIYAPATVTSITPSAASAGDTITINGENLVGVRES